MSLRDLGYLAPSVPAARTPRQFDEALLQRAALRSLIARLVASLDGNRPSFFAGVELDELECQLIREAIATRGDGDDGRIGF